MHDIVIGLYINAVEFWIDIHAKCRFEPAPYNEMKIYTTSRIRVMEGNLPKVMSPLIAVINSVETIQTNKCNTVVNEYLKNAIYNSWKEKIRKNNIKLLVDLFLCDLFCITKDVSKVNAEKLVNEMMLEENPKQKLKFVLQAYKQYYK